MMDDARIDLYVRRITPIREQWQADLERLEAEAEAKRRLLVGKGRVRGYSGRYWALGPAIDALALKNDVAAIEEQLDADIAALNSAYQDASRRIRQEVGL